MAQPVGCRRGALIAIEGCDGVGKTSHCKLLVNRLKEKQKDCVYMAFPNTQTPIGRLIRRYLKHKEILPIESAYLLFSANRWEMNPAIRTYLNNGTTVILDGYTYSGIVHGMSYGLEFEWCRAPDINLIQPDGIFLLTVPNDVLKERSNLKQVFRKRYKMDMSLLERAANNFLQFTEMINIDNSQQMPFVNNMLLEHVNKIMDEIVNK